MKWALGLVTLLHGLIHLIGFTKAFGLATVEQLQQPISRPLGLAWLAAAVLLVAAAALVFAAPRLWWAPAALGLVVSQAVIFTSWSDARFGTIANAIVLAGLVLTALGRDPAGA